MGCPRKGIQAAPAWSPDSSKVAAAFDADVMIFDAATAKPTQARIGLRDALIAASKIYEEKAARGEKNDNGTKQAERGASQAAIPASFNPIVRLEWITPEKLHFQTAYVRLFRNEPINTFQRWHLLILSPQAAVLK